MFTYTRSRGVASLPTHETDALLTRANEKLGLSLATVVRVAHTRRYDQAIVKDALAAIEASLALLRWE